jgi:hypothetical protein
MGENLPLIIDRARLAGKLSFFQYLQARKMFPALKGIKLTEGTITYHPSEYKSRLHFGLGVNEAIASVEVFALPNKKCSLIFGVWPHRCTGTRFQEFHSAITSILPDDEFTYKSVFYEGHIQHIEYAYDLLNIKMHSFLPWTARAKFSDCYKEQHLGMDEDKGTIYIGAKNSPIRFSVYNKALKMEKDGLINAHPIRSRLEAIVFEPYRLGSLVQRLRPCELDKQLNPFRFLEISELDTARKLSENPDWQWFLDISEYGGAPAAFVEVFATKKERLKARQMLRQCAAKWWNPANAWEGHIQANAAIHPATLLQ